MKRHVWAAISLVSCCVAEIRAQPTLGFSGLDCGSDVVIGGDPCEPEGRGAGLLDPILSSREVDCVLTAPSTSVQGWSISVGADGLTITGITDAGTVAADVSDGGLRDGGFLKSELTSGEGNEGAVSAVVLSFTKPVTLDNPDEEPIATLTVEGGTLGKIGEVTTVRMFYRDGFQGSGQPVSNNLTVDGATVQPAFSECSVNFQLVGPPISCPSKDLDGVQLLFTAVGSNLQNPDALANTFPPCGGPVSVFGESTVYAAIGSSGVAGVQGWSLSLSATGTGQLTDATVEGTVGADVRGDPPGLRDGGFEKTELVDPSKNDQGRGVVSAVVLSFTKPITLDPIGQATVLAMGVFVDGNESLTIAAREGLQGSGQGVNNVTTIDGGTVEFACTAPIHLEFVDIGRYAQGGDANSDARIDLSDVIFLVNALFRNGPFPSCQAAADANDDRMLDLSDAMFVIAYLWQGGPAPSGALGGGDCKSLNDGGGSCLESSPGCDV